MDKDRLIEIGLTSLFFILVIIFSLHSLLFKDNNYEGNRIEQRVVIQKQMRGVKDPINMYEYRIYFDDDSFVTIGRELYNKIDVGEEVEIEYDEDNVVGVGVCDE